MSPIDDHKKILKAISIDLINNYVDMMFHTTPVDDPDPDNTDKVHLYAKRLLSLGCFYLEYSDAIREGDGDRVLQCWRYLLPMFVISRRKTMQRVCTCCYSMTLHSLLNKQQN